MVPFASLVIYVVIYDDISRILYVCAFTMQAEDKKAWSRAQLYHDEI